MIKFPDYEYFNDVNIAYSDLIQRITSVMNKTAPFKEVKIESYSHYWFDGEILVRIILRDKRLKKNVRPLELIFIVRKGLLSLLFKSSPLLPIPPPFFKIVSSRQISSTYFCKNFAIQAAKL